MRPGSASYARLPADEIAELQAQITQLQTELRPTRTDSEGEGEEAEEEAERARGLNAPHNPQRAPSTESTQRAQPTMADRPEYTESQEVQQEEEHDTRSGPEPEPEPDLTLQVDQTTNGTELGGEGDAQQPMSPSMAEFQELKQQVSLSLVHRDSVSAGSSAGSTSQHENEEKHKAENVKLRQVLRSARAATTDDSLLRMLSAADDPEDDGLRPLDPTKEPPSAPDDRKLRQTDVNVGVCGGLYFTPDARTLVHGGWDDQHLSLWDLCTTKCQHVKGNSSNVYGSAVSPDGQLLCIAAGHGLTMYTFTRSGVEEPVIKQLWEHEIGNKFVNVAFSGDGTVVAAVRWDGGVLQILEARPQSRSGLVDCTVEDFPAVQHAWGHNCLAFSGDVLAVSGRHDHPNNNQVRLYRWQPDSGPQALQTLTTLTTPEGQAHNISMPPSGTKLAVGMGDECALGVAIYSDSNNWGDPPLVLRSKYTCCTAFSSDERYLCTASPPRNLCSIWDLQTAVRVRAIPSDGCHACAFSPADELVAAASNSVRPGHPARLHELWDPPPVHSFQMPRQSKITAAVASNSVIVLASGKRLAALDRNDDEMQQWVCRWHQDLDEIAWAERCGTSTMALQPTGGQLAVCVHKLGTVSIRDLKDGKVQKDFMGQQSLRGVRYSPDGSLLIIVTAGGTHLYSSTNPWNMLHNFAGQGGYDAGIDRFNKLLVMTGPPGANAVVSLDKHGDDTNTEPPHEDTQTKSTPQTGHTRFATTADTAHKGRKLLLDLDLDTEFFAGVFDDAGDRMVCGCGSNTGAMLYERKQPDGKWENTQTWDITKTCGIRWVSHAEFSPGDGRYLLLATYGDGHDSGCGRIVFLDTETGKEPPWSRCFRPLMLPSGKFSNHVDGSNPVDSVRWVRGELSAAQAEALHTSDSCADSRQAANDDEAATKQPLVLQATIDENLYLIDVAPYIHAFEEDGNFSMKQLYRLSGIDTDAIPSLLDKWPHIVNAREKETGDTVLHHCARERKFDALGKWLSGKEPFSHVENKQQDSALWEVVNALHYKAVPEMLRRLDPDIPLRRTDTLTRDIVAIAEAFPHDVVDLIELLHGSDVRDAVVDESGNSPRGHRLFRHLRKYRLLIKRLDPPGFAVRASTEEWTLAEGDPDWPEFIGSDASFKSEAALIVLGLKDFASAPTEDSLPPYTRLYQACANASREELRGLMDTELMDVVTEFKWDAYCKRRVYLRLALYVMHFTLAAVAMLMSSQFAEQNLAFHEHGGWGGEWNKVDAAITCDLLIAALLVSNTLVTLQEMRQANKTEKTTEKRPEKREKTTEKTTEKRPEKREKTTACTGGASCVSRCTLYLSSGWNIVDAMGIVALYGAIVSHLIHSEVLLQYLGSLGVLLNAFSLLQLMTPFKSTGPLVRTVIEIMRDISGFVIILFVLMWGFSVSFAVSMPKNQAFVDDSGPLVGLLTSFEAVVGLFHMSDFQNAEATTFFMVYLFGIVVVMLNLLIAIMADSYEKVKESEVLEARMLRAQTIIDEEALMSEADRKNEEYFPRFLYVLKATDAKRQEWSGLSGKIAMEVESVKTEVASVKTEVASMKTEVDTAMAAQTKTIQDIVEAQRAMQQGMGDLKVLLEQSLQQASSSSTTSSGK